MSIYDRFNMPVLRRPLEPEQYTSAEFNRYCTRVKVRPSMGRTGVCWDNAAAESFFATLKNEMYHRYRFLIRNGRSASRDSTGHADE